MLIFTHTLTQNPTEDGHQPGRCDNDRRIPRLLPQGSAYLELNGCVRLDHMTAGKTVHAAGRLRVRAGHQRSGRGRAAGQSGRTEGRRKQRKLEREQSANGK